VYFLLILTLVNEEQKICRKRRNHSPGFKSKVALAALKGNKNLAQLASEFDVHVNQIQSWQCQIKDNISDLFDNPAEVRKDHQGEVKEVRAKIGQFTMENDCLSKALEP
jgi:transposase